MTTPYNPTENAIDAAIQREIDTPDRYPTTQSITCETCAWKYSQTNGVPAECPACERAKRMADLNRVLSSNSDLKKGTT